MRAFLRQNWLVQRVATGIVPGILLILGTSSFGQDQQEEPLLKRPESETIIQRGQEKPHPQPTGESDGLAYSEIFRDTDPPYHDTFSDLTVGGSGLARLGPQGAATFDANFFHNTRLQTPFTRAIRPEDAELKLGIFYVDVTSVSASMIFSDNINQTEHNAESGAIAIMRMNMGVMLQLGDNFRFNARGAVVYLPLRNAIGVAGFINDPLFQFYPIAEAEVAYDLHLNHWEIEFLDNLTVRHRLLGEDADFNYLQGETLDEEDRAGRYGFRNALLEGRNFRRIDLEPNPNLVEGINTVGARASRMLPTDTLMEMGAFHQNREYSRRATFGSGALPHVQDFAYINLISERETMRFKPFAGYRISKYDNQPDWSHRFRTGIRGPITDYVFLRADVGYFTGSTRVRDHESLLWRISLDHDPTPLFHHRLQYAREISDPEQQVEDTLSYRIRYEINPDLWAELYAMYSRIDDQPAPGTSADEFHHGGRITYRLAQRMTASFGLVYTSVDYDSHRLGTVDLWTGRLDLRYDYSEALTAWLTYRHQIRDSTRLLNSYEEDTVWLTVIKYF